MFVEIHKRSFSMRSHNLDSIPIFCQPCFKLILKSKFYLEIEKPYLTVDCLEKEICIRRMIFTENSLQQFIYDPKELNNFLENYNIIRENYRKCFSCKTMFIPYNQSFKIDIFCKKCKKKTCKVCWNEFHPRKLCQYLLRDYNLTPLKNMIGKIFVCPLCFAISRVNQHHKCENCNRSFCKF